MPVVKSIANVAVKAIEPMRCSVLTAPLTGDDTITGMTAAEAGLRAAAAGTASANHDVGMLTFTTDAEGSVYSKKPVASLPKVLTLKLA